MLARVPLAMGGRARHILYVPMSTDEQRTALGASALQQIAHVNMATHHPLALRGAIGAYLRHKDEEENREVVDEDDRDARNETRRWIVADDQQQGQLEHEHLDRGDHTRRDPFGLREARVDPARPEGKVVAEEEHRYMPHHNREHEVELLQRQAGDSEQCDELHAARGCEPAGQLIAAQAPTPSERGA